MAGMPAAGAPPVTDAFGAIAHPVRRSLVTALASGDKPVNALAAAVPVSRPAVSQHLALLRSVGLVSEQRHGRERRYHLHPERLDEVRKWMHTLDKFWESRLDRLGRHLEENP
jgi:DNA-binding transcriptional ArsR family regulator